MTDLAFAGLAEHAALLDRGETTSQELTELFLERIERYDPLLNAYRVVFADMARAEEWARERNLGAIELGFREFNADAIGFYKQPGYTTLSRTMRKPLGDPSCE